MTRSANCYRHLVAGGTYWDHEDAVLCRSRLRNANATTDADGNADFRALTVVSAITGSYVLWLTVSGPGVVGSVSLQHMFTLSSPLQAAYFNVEAIPTAFGQPFDVVGWLFLRHITDPVTEEPVPADVFVGGECAVVSLDIDHRFNFFDDLPPQVQTPSKRHYWRW